MNRLQVELKNRYFVDSYFSTYPLLLINKTSLDIIEDLIMRIKKGTNDEDFSCVVTYEPSEDFDGYVVLSSDFRLIENLSVLDNISVMTLKERGLNNIQHLKNLGLYESRNMSVTSLDYQDRLYVSIARDLHTNLNGKCVIIGEVLDKLSKEQVERLLYFLLVKCKGNAKVIICNDHNWLKDLIDPICKSEVREIRNVLFKES